MLYQFFCQTYENRSIYKKTHVKFWQHAVILWQSSVVSNPLVTNVLAKSPKSTIITGKVEPPHMAARIPNAINNLSCALENRNWK